MKTCTRCRAVKFCEAFSIKRASPDGLSPWCRQCISDHAKAKRSGRPPKAEGSWYQRNTTVARHRAMVRVYGITPAEYEAFLVAQSDCCAICGTGVPGGRRDVGRFFIDHDHETGAVRGLLCNSCNLILGHAKDSSERLRAAAAYLERFSG